MGIIKKFLMIILVIVGTGAVLVYGSRYIPEGKLTGVKNAANQIQPFVSSNIQHANVGQLSQVGGQLTTNVQSISGKVLGVQDSAPASASSSSSQTNQSLPQRAFELARYSYCKEVVKEYESR